MQTSKTCPLCRLRKLSTKLAVLSYPHCFYVSFLERIYLYEKYTLHLLFFRSKPRLQKSPGLMALCLHKIPFQWANLQRGPQLSLKRWMDIALTSQEKCPLWCDCAGLRVITAVGMLCSEVAGPGKWKHMAGYIDYRRAVWPYV